MDFHGTMRRMGEKTGPRGMGYLPAVVLFVVMAASFGLAAGSLSAQNPSYTIIQTQQDFDGVIAEVQKLLLSNFAIALKLPVTGLLVPAKKLDELYSGAYRGAEVGFYHFVNGRHEMYVMQDMDRDDCIGTTAHELVHAWQTECCPIDQDIVVKEGFARWVQYKLFDKTGAYVRAQSIKEAADPVYGVGFKKMLEWEDQLGEVGVVLKVRKVKKLSD